MTFSEGKERKCNAIVQTGANAATVYTVIDPEKAAGGDLVNSSGEAAAAKKNEN